MRKLLVVVMVALGAVALATTAGAQQYPPDGGPSTTAVTAQTTDGPGSVLGDGAGQGGGQVAGAGASAGDGVGAQGAPLPRTGSDVATLALVGTAMVGAGLFAVTTARSRRRRGGA